MQDPNSYVLGAIDIFFDSTPEIHRANRVLVAVSGGADSVALLVGLVELGVDAGVAHLDHGTRDGQSSKDASWVENLASSMALPYYFRKIDVPALAEGSSKSFEEIARYVRYDFLAEVAEENKYSLIATGHHANDQSETVLMRLIRGTSLTGLAGIPAMGEWNGIPVIRPLLDVAREDIVDYLSKKGVAFLEDSTNLDHT